MNLSSSHTSGTVGESDTPKREWPEYRGWGWGTEHTGSLTAFLARDGDKANGLYKCFRARGVRKHEG